MSENEYYRVSQEKISFRNVYNLECPSPIVKIPFKIILGDQSLIESPDHDLQLFFGLKPNQT